MRDSKSGPFNASFFRTSSMGEKKFQRLEFGHVFFVRSSQNNLSQARVLNRTLDVRAFLKRFSHLAKIPFPDRLQELFSRDLGLPGLRFFLARALFIGSRFVQEACVGKRAPS